jgi:hypothetical protein
VPLICLQDGLPALFVSANPPSRQAAPRYVWHQPEPCAGRKFPRRMTESNGRPRAKALARTYIAKLAEFIRLYGDDREEFCRVEGMHDIVTALKAMHDAEIDPFQNRAFQQLCRSIDDRYFKSRHSRS